MLNPILSFSATRRMRSFKTLLIAAVWLLVMMGVALLIMGQLFRSGASINGLRTGVTCYQILIIVQFILIILVAPAMTSCAVESGSGVKNPLAWSSQSVIRERKSNRSPEGSDDEAGCCAGLLWGW